MFALALLGLAMAQEPGSAEISRLYYGARTGLSVPLDAAGVAPSVGAELGIERGLLQYGLRLMFYPNPPDFLGYTDVSASIGPLADVRLNAFTVRQLDLYGIGTLGFLVGQDDGRNAFLPILAAGVGARGRLPGDRFAVSFDFGLTDFTVPYFALSLNGLSRPVEP